MCGILGVYSVLPGVPLPSASLFKDALDLMRYRGPDAQGVFEDHGNILLGHNRLSVIDLSDAANQPFRYADLLIAFNGEIYNYTEIREELKRKAYTFRTESDTEVIGAAFKEWGKDCLQRFNGMWAFAVYNETGKSLFLARDRFGVKPLYYHTNGGTFSFSSAVKSLLKLSPGLARPNFAAISAYCRESAGGESPDTWFEGIHRLPPAHCVSISGQDMKVERYWHYPTHTSGGLSFDEAKATFRRLFEDAVRIRMRSDVPVGATLSSGIDSHAIVSAAARFATRPLPTYTASFPDQPYDEFPVVDKWKDVSGYTPHRQVIRYDHFLSELGDLIFYMESGHSSPAILPLNQLLKTTREDVTVFLEGQGADELMGGYVNAVFFDYLLDLFKRLEFAKIWREIHYFRKNWSLTYALLLYLRVTLPPGLRRYARKLNNTEGIYGEKLRRQPGPSRRENIPGGFKSRLKRRLYRQHSGGLVNLLSYGNAISMSHSLESRLPFMDYRLVEFIFRLPGHFLIHQGKGKYLMREALKDSVPGEILNSGTKIGFTSPFEAVFHDTTVRDFMLGHSLCTGKGWFKRQHLENLLKGKGAGAHRHYRLLFRVLCVMIWYDTFIGEPETA